MTAWIGADSALPGEAIKLGLKRVDMVTMSKRMLRC